MKSSLLFAVGECFLGFLLVAESPKGICAILLGDNVQDLKKELQIRFSHEELIEKSQQSFTTLNTLIAHLDKPIEQNFFEIDEQGTPFQILVWKALREIPWGTTLSYKDVAEKIGRPSAYRAVAGACAANPIAIITPCHRVLRNNKAISGYRWGVERKAALLKIEGVNRQ